MTKAKGSIRMTKARGMSTIVALSSMYVKRGHSEIMHTGAIKNAIHMGVPNCGCLVLGALLALFMFVFVW